MSQTNLEAVGGGCDGNVSLTWGGAPHQAVNFQGIAFGVAGAVSLDGAQTSYEATADGIPATVNLTSGAPAPVLDTQARAIGYVPSNLANWSGVAPTSVANALDRIAAKITPIP